MNSSQFKEIEKFFETMPKLSHTVTVRNPKTKKDNTKPEDPEENEERRVIIIDI